MINNLVSRSTPPATINKGNIEKMKKTYFAPECEEIKLKMNVSLLAESDIVGGGIGDDNTGDKGTEPGDPGLSDW